MSPVWAEVEEAQLEDMLLRRTVVALMQMWQRRCDSCQETRSESETGGGEAVVEAGPLPPSGPLETYQTETWEEAGSLWNQGEIINEN